MWTYTFVFACLADFAARPRVLCERDLRSVPGDVRAEVLGASFKQWRNETLVEALRTSRSNDIRFFRDQDS